MKKEDQIQFVAFNAGILKSEAEKTLKLIGQMVRVALSDDNGKPVLGNSIKVIGLGTWEVKKSPAKKGVNPQVLGAEKAMEAGNATEKHVALLQAVKAGTVAREYEKAEGLKVAFKPEAAFAAWCGEDVEAGDEDPAEGETVTADNNVAAADQSNVGTEPMGTGESEPKAE